MISLNWKDIIETHTIEQVLNNINAFGEEFNNNESNFSSRGGVVTNDPEILFIHKLEMIHVMHFDFFFYNNFFDVLIFMNT